MTRIEQKLINYANAVIDDICIEQGIETAIDRLITFGFTKNQLVSMGFNINDINSYLKGREGV
jgi:hypothetical protein